MRKGSKIHQLGPRPPEAVLVATVACAVAVRVVDEVEDEEDDFEAAARSQRAMVR